jgi:hypothetical protein
VIARRVTVVIVVCAATAGAHAALVPGHLEHEPRLGIAFLGATALLLAAAVALAYRPDDTTVGTATAVLLAALIGAYAVNITTGLPWLSDGPEPLDIVGFATKSVEGIGLLFSIQLAPIKGGFDSLTHKEARP